MNPAFHPDALVIDTRLARTGEKHLGVWRWKRDDDFAPLWSAANDAARVAGGFFADRETYDNDEHLSVFGKAEKVRESAKSALRDFGAAQKRLTSALAKIAATRQQLAAVRPIPAGVEGVAERLLDIELARALREMPANDRQDVARRLLSGEEQRVIEAVLRVPAIVSGLSENMRGLIEHAAIQREHPEQVMRAEAMKEAASMAQRIVTKSARLVLEHAGLDLGDQLKALGGEWRGIIPAHGPEDAMDALARKHAQEAA